MIEGMSVLNAPAREPALIGRRRRPRVASEGPSANSRRTLLYETLSMITAPCLEMPGSLRRSGPTAWIQARSWAEGIGGASYTKSFASPRYRKDRLTVTGRPSSFEMPSRL